MKVKRKQREPLPSSHVKRGDEVVVISGTQRGKRGKVLQVLPKTHRVVVEGLNLVTKAVRKSPSSEGGLLKREGGVHISNVMLVSTYETSRAAAKKTS
jgi:large subunit ribosomal protein L24